MNPLLTNSRAKAYRTCPQKHFYAHELGVRAIRQADALVFGDGIHRGLEAWLSHRRLGDALAALPTFPSPYVAAKARAMLAGYDVMWRESGYEPVAIEKEFHVPFVVDGARHELDLGGKFDAIVRDRLGDVWVMEHKTSAENVAAGSAYRRKLAMDGQVSQYVYAARAIGFDVKGCIYDVLVKPTHKPLLATPVEKLRYTKAGDLYATQRSVDESPDEYEARIMDAIGTEPGAYYARIEVRRTTDELRRWERETWSWGWRILRDQAPLRNTDACFNHGAPCEFLPVCEGTAAIDDRETYEFKGVNPELGVTARSP